MDDLQLLHRTGSPGETPTPDVLARGKKQLLAQIAAEDTSAVAAPGTVHRLGRHPQPVLFARPGRRLLGSLVATAAAAALAAALVISDVVGAPATLQGATAEAATLLTQAADATIRTSDPVVGEGQFLRVDTTAVWGNFGPTGDYLSEETWSWFIPADKNDEWVMTRSWRKPTVFFDEDTEREALADYEETVNEYGPDGPPTVRGPNGYFAFENDASTTSPFLSDAELAALPRDPQAMLEHIYTITEGQGPSRDGQAFSTIAEMLWTGVIPADLRATLYKTCALIPGVEVLDEAANLEGETGVAFGRTENNGADREEIIIDPDTGLLIGERTILLEDQGEIPAGTVAGSTAIRTTVVDDAP